MICIYIENKYIPTMMASMNMVIKHVVTPTSYDNQHHYETRVKLEVHIMTKLAVASWKNDTVPEIHEISRPRSRDSLKTTLPFGATSDAFMTIHLDSWQQ